jgi:hypothetical protein
MSESTIKPLLLMLIDGIEKKGHFQDYSQWIYRCDRCGNQHIVDYTGFSFQFNGEEVDKEYITF